MKKFKSLQIKESLIINHQSLIIKRMLIVLLMTTFFLGSYSHVVFAEILGVSEDLSLTITPTVVAISDEDEGQGLVEKMIEDVSITTDSSWQSNAVNSLAEDGNYFSATFRAEKLVKKLSKSSFQAKEKIEVVVKNVLEEESGDINIEIKNKRLNQVNAQVEKDFVNGELVFSINPEVGITPGIYTVSVIDGGEVLFEQDFTWGVLAINTNKSIYLKNENANIAIAVLDESGHMVCDSDVNLEITAPWGQKTNLSTMDGTIIVNEECKFHAVTKKPDYETNYLTSDVGRYLMTLSATTENGTYITRDRFEVREYVPFEVERITATRIYPPERYPVKIKIKANKDFSGKIVETVPQDFQIKILEEEGVVKFSSESALLQASDSVDMAKIPNLPLPFDGEYPVSLGFGQQIEGHGMELVYKKSGIDGHDGIDFSLPEGVPAMAVDEGIVILAEEDWVYGHTVVIEHSWGRSYYGHLSEIIRKEGENVSAGTILGNSGSTGLSTGPHLHFSIKPNINDINNLYYGKIDPAPYLGIANEDPSLSVSEYPLAAKALIWDISIKKDEEIVIGYDYKSPNKSPYFYTLGPLQFISSELNTTIDSAKFDVTKNKFILGTSTDLEKQNVEEEVIFAEIRKWQIAVDSVTILTSGTSWSVPADWNDSNNSIEVIGAGGGGGGSGANGNQEGGGGAGAGGVYAKETNVNLPESGTVTIAIGAAGSGGSQGASGTGGGDTYFCNSTSNCVSISGTAVVAGGKGGGGGSSGSADIGGSGGTILAGSVGTTIYNGGTGGAGGDSLGGGSKQGGSGGGGGGAGGLNAVGTAGTTASIAPANGGAGGQGDGTSGGAGGSGGTHGTCSVGGTGSNGAEWDASTGSGGGGGGGGGGNNGAVGCAGGAGGTYGAAGGGGGGGGKSADGAAGGGGIQGVIIINYTTSGPTNEQIMRHGKWFSGGAKQHFSFKKKLMF